MAQWVRVRPPPGRGLGHCCGSGSVPGPGPSTRHGQNKKNQPTNKWHFYPSQTTRCSSFPVPWRLLVLSRGALLPGEDTHLSLSISVLLLLRDTVLPLVAAKSSSPLVASPTAFPWSLGWHRAGRCQPFFLRAARASRSGLRVPGWVPSTLSLCSLAAWGSAGVPGQPGGSGCHGPPGPP